MTVPIDVLVVSRDRSLREALPGDLETRHRAIAVRDVVDPSADEGFEAVRQTDCIVLGDPVTGDAADHVHRILREASTVPVFLFPPQGAAESINAALRAGVTDYVVRTGDRDSVSLLADRIVDAVERRRAEERAGELERLNTVIRDLDRALVRATTASEIDRRVCELLSRSEPYVFAWIGELDPQTGRVTPRASAGIEARYLEDSTITSDEEPTGKGPTGRAIDTNEPQFVQNILENPAYEPWREQAVERGYRSSGAIPLVYEGTRYGVLNLYANRTNAFDDRERALLAEVGDDIAHALYRAQVGVRQERAERIIENLPVGVCRVRPGPRGTFVDANPALARILGAGSTDELLEHHISDFYREREDRAAFSRQLQSQGVVRDQELRLSTLDGDDIRVSVTAIRTKEDGEVYFDEIMYDITERRERQQRIEHLSETLETIRRVNRRLVRATDRRSMLADVVAVISDHATFSCTFLALLDGDEPEFVCETHSHLTRDQVREFHTEAYVNDVLEADILAIDDVTTQPHQQHFAGEEAHEGVAIAIQHGDRAFGILTIHLPPGESPTDTDLDLLEELGEDVGFALHNLTVEKERERLSDNLQDSLRQLQILDRVLRHNLRNDMNIIMNAAELIEAEADGDIADYADTIRTKGDDLLTTVDKERDITQLLSEPTSFESVEVGHLVEEVVSGIAEQYPAATITVDRPDRAVVKATDSLALALEELLTNAIVHSDRETPTVEVGVAVDDSAVELRVADDGPGIPEMERRILTEEAETGPLYHGSGLGLWLVKLIVQEADGSLSFAENQPRGGIVRIRLPKPVYRE